MNRQQAFVMAFAGFAALAPAALRAQSKNLGAILTYDGRCHKDFFIGYIKLTPVSGSLAPLVTANIDEKGYPRITVELDHSLPLDQQKNSFLMGTNAIRNVIGDLNKKCRASRPTLTDQSIPQPAMRL